MKTDYITSVTKFTFTCDTCGKEKHSLQYNVFDENYNLQVGLIQCNDCQNNLI